MWIAAAAGLVGPWVYAMQFCQFDCMLQHSVLSFVQFRDSCNTNNLCNAETVVWEDRLHPGNRHTGLTFWPGCLDYYIIHLYIVAIAGLGNSVFRAAAIAATGAARSAFAAKPAAFGQVVMAQMAGQLTGANARSCSFLSGGTVLASAVRPGVQATPPAVCRPTPVGLAPIASNGVNFGRGLSSLVCAEASTSGTGSSAQQQPLQRRQGGGRARQARKPGAPRATSTAPSAPSASSSSSSSSAAASASAVPAAAAADAEALLFIGFHPEEMEIIRQQLPAVAPVAAAAPAAVPGGDGGESGEEGLLALVDVTAGMLGMTLREAMVAAAAAGESSSSSGTISSGGGSEGHAPPPSAAAVAAGRVVLLRGPGAQELGAELNDLLTEWGVVPALVAAATAKCVSGSSVVRGPGRGYGKQTRT